MDDNKDVTKEEVNSAEVKDAEAGKVAPENTGDANTDANEEVPSNEEGTGMDAFHHEEGENDVEAISKKAKELEEENIRLQAEIKVPEKYDGEEKAVAKDPRQSEKYDTFRALGLNEAQAKKFDIERKKAVLKKTEILKKKNVEELARQKKSIPNFNSKMDDIAAQVKGGKDSFTYKSIMASPKLIAMWTELVGVLNKSDADSGVTNSAKNKDSDEEKAREVLAGLQRL